MIVIEYYESNNVQLNIPGYDKRSKQSDIYTIQNNNLNNIKLKPSDLLLMKDKNILNNKILNLDDNVYEYKLSNSNSNYNLFNFKEHMGKSKLFNDNNSTRMNMNMNNNKSNLMKRINYNEDINNYNYNNKLGSRNMGFVGVSKKQNKLALFDQNKNFGIFNNPNLTKEKKIYKNKSQLSDIKEQKGGKNYNNSNSCGKNKNSSSAEPKKKQVSHSQKDYREENSALYLSLTRNLTNNNIMNKNGNNSIKDNVNKSSEELPYINNNKNIKKTNTNKSVPKNNQANVDNVKKTLNITNDINIQKNNSFVYDNLNLKNNYINYNNNTKNKIDRNKILSKTIVIKNTKNNNDDTILKALSEKEKAYYLLSQSKVLQLHERIIFSKTTKIIKSLISIDDIVKSNELFIKDKIVELEKQINDYNSSIKSPFTPSKIAMMSLNLIMKDDKDDFIHFLINNDIEEKEKDYYNLYVELLFILLGENYKNNEKDINILYEKLGKKGYDNFKDYFYEIFISHKAGKELLKLIKMDEFNELFEKLPDLIKYQGDIKNCRFISFSYFLLLEIYNYLNKLKECIDLKNKTQSYIQRLKNKLTYINK